MISFNNIGNLGRLANQMFQYASLKGIARNRGYDFCIPPSELFGQRDTLVKGVTTVKDELSDMSVKVDNMSLEIKDVQAEAQVQRKMLESHMAQWVSGLFLKKAKN